jgi:hypothetical protein
MWIDDYAMGACLPFLSFKIKHVHPNYHIFQIHISYEIYDKG